VYEIQDFDSMFADAPRTSAYLAAIAGAVKPGCVVVEIGTGVGYFAVAACKAGARIVYAIEMNPAIELGAQVAADNDCADRVTFIRNDSRKVTLPELGDVLLSDLRGVLPPYGEHIPTLIDARTRLVRADASLVPQRDTMWAAPCVAPPEWRRDHLTRADAPHGISRRAVEARVRADWYRCHLDGESLVQRAEQWAALDYRTIESPNLSGRASWTFTRDASADGLALWFDGDFGGGALLSNSPSAPRALYGQAFFPFERSLQIRAGDVLDVELSANHIGNDYVWGWTSTLRPVASDDATIVFRQSNLVARVGSLDRLRNLGAPVREGDRPFPTTQSTA
jgi:protein arginine N-methyltransferase 1